MCDSTVESNICTRDTLRYRPEPLPQQPHTTAIFCIVRSLRDCLELTPFSPPSEQDASEQISAVLFNGSAPAIPLIPSATGVPRRAYASDYRPCPPTVACVYNLTAASE